MRLLFAFVAMACFPSSRILALQATLRTHRLTGRGSCSGGKSPISIFKEYNPLSSTAREPKAVACQKGKKSVEQNTRAEETMKISPILRLAGDQRKPVSLRAKK